MNEAGGIPQLIDLTHVQDMMVSGKYLLGGLVLALMLAAIYGLVLSLLGRASLPQDLVGSWARDYGRVLKGLQHLALSAWLLVTTFLVSSTLANRYHHWEQSQVQSAAQTVEGSRLEQQTPSVRYFTTRQATTTQYVDGKPVEVTRPEAVSHSLNLAASDIQVGLEQFVRDETTQRLGYKVDFKGEYTFKNTLTQTRTFFFDAYLPSSYSLLEGFRVEREGQPLSGGELSERSFKFDLAPGESTRFSIRYQAQGDPRWVYTANQSLLSNFRLTLQANFAGAEFASGIPPTRTEPKAKGTTFVWEFKDNVSVQNPFGVFTLAHAPLQATGVMPRLLLLAPALLLGWLLLMYATLNMRPIQVFASGGLFLAALLSLTYLSRVIDALVAWPLLAIFVAGMVWLQHRGQRWAALICAFAGLLLPVFALMTRYAGLFLGLSALLAVLWLTIRQNQASAEIAPETSLH